METYKQKLKWDQFSPFTKKYLCIPPGCARCMCHEAGLTHIRDDLYDDVGFLLFQVS